MRGHAERHVEVAGPASHTAVAARPGDSKLQPIRHAGRDLDGHASGGSDPPLAAAVPARSGDLLPRPVAHGARARRHDRPEHASAHVLDLSGPSAPVAPRGVGAGLATRALAPRASLQGGHLHLVLAAERRLLEGKPQLDQEVLAAANPRPPPGAGPPPAHAAEEHVEDVTEIAEAEQVSVHPRALRSEHVVLAPLGRIRQRLVRGRDLLEPSFGSGIAVDVRMELAGQPPVRPLDVVVAGVPGDPEDPVQIRQAGHGSPSLPAVPAEPALQRPRQPPRAATAAESLSATARTAAMAFA